MSTQEINSETVGFRLSPQQAWLQDAEAGRSVVQCAAVLAGPVREADLKAALQVCSTRHEILRTTFPRPAGMRDRSQVIHDSLALEWRVQSEDTESGLLDHASLAALLAGEAQRGFDLERGPLLRALLLSSEGSPGLIALTAYAGCADAASLLVILAELTGNQGGEAEPVQYADYAEWRHELIAGEDEQAVDGRALWRAQAEQRPPVPRLLLVGTGTPGNGALPVEVPFTPVELDGLRAAAAAAGVAVPVFLEACWHAVIARLTDSTEVTLAGWCDGRTQPDLDGAVGPYAQPVAISSRLQSDTSLAEVLDQVRRARAEGARWQDFASPEDIGALTAGAVGGFAHFELPPNPPGVLEIAALNAAPGMSLLLSVRSCGEQLRVELRADPASFGPAEASELATRFHALLSGAMADPSRPVALLPLADAHEREAILADAVGPAPDEDAGILFHHGFEQRATSAPSAPAVAGATGRLSYGELNARANRLAHLLRDAGVGRGDVVGLAMERTPALLVAVLGILKAGGAYLPLNYDHPAARIAHQLSESKSRVLVTEEHLLARLPEFAGQVVCLDRDRERIAAFAEEDPEPVAGLDDVAYVIYTSGSTGLPKGVAVTHRNLANYAAHMSRRLTEGSEAAAGLRFGVVSAISTDLGNTCIFPALLSGGSVRLISPGASMDGESMAGELGDDRLDVLKITPSHLRALIAGENGPAILPRRWLVTGGEALSWELVQRIRELSPDVGILNHYGPTECTIGCCAYEVGQPRADAATVPIGRPLAGSTAYVLDRRLEPLAPGIPGELCVGGAGVAAGYIGTAPDAAESTGPFVSDPFSAEPGRMYRTGDRVRRLHDGTIEFLGRIDDQVKIRGFRIEPGEIETVLARHPAVRQAAVVPEPDDRGELRLVAYISASGEPTVDELQAHLSTSLPEYMVPAAFAKLDSLPFTPSGKIDRKALASLATAEMRREAQYVAPRDAIEEQIAGIWSELLGTDQVGVFDDFFALGGHSLLATQAIMRIRREHADIPLRALLAAPTVATLADVVRGGPIRE